MKRLLPLAAALAAGLVASAGADHQKLTAHPEGTPVVVVGRISSPPRGEIEEKKMQVAIGRRKMDVTLHFKDAELTGLNGEKIDEDGFDDGQWVRAEGTVMADPRRIRVTRIQVIGEKSMRNLHGTAHFRPGFNRGYLVATGSSTAPAGLAEGTQVVLVGQVTSPPKGAIEEKKMQVGVGPGKLDYTVHFKDAHLAGLFGQKIDEDGFDNGQWVRAEGTVMDDPRRIKATRVQVIAKDQAALHRSAFGRPGLEHGYLMTVAGSRQTFPEAGRREPLFHSGQMVIVGRVSDDTGPAEATRKIQVQAAGNEWTLHVPEEATVLSETGEKLSVHEIKEGQWIRATGMQTDDLRLKVARMENIGPEEAFRKSTFFRTEWPMGYVERLEEKSSPKR